MKGRLRARSARDGADYRCDRQLRRVEERGMRRRGQLVRGLSEPLLAGPRWRSTPSIQTKELAEERGAPPWRSARREDTRRCTIPRMLGRACVPAQRQSVRVRAGPASVQSMRPACPGNPIACPSQVSTLAAPPYVKRASVGNIQRAAIRDMAASRGHFRDFNHASTSHPLGAISSPLSLPRRERDRLGYPRASRTASSRPRASRQSRGAQKPRGSSRMPSSPAARAPRTSTE